MFRNPFLIRSVVTGSTTLQHMAFLRELDASLPFLGALCLLCFGSDISSAARAEMTRLSSASAARQICLGNDEFARGAVELPRSGELIVGQTGMDSATAMAFESQILDATPQWLSLIPNMSAFTILPPAASGY
jgi:hypothetical protein